MTDDNIFQEQRTSREISNANLIPYESGQSGNPGGKHEGKSITAELRKLIDKGTNAEDTAQILYDIAKKGSRAQMEALKELLNRTDGKVPDTHKIESDIPISIVFKEIERKE